MENNMLAGTEKISVRATKKIHKKIYPRGYYTRGFYLEKHSLNATLVRIAVRKKGGGKKYAIKKGKYPKTIFPFQGGTPHPPIAFAGIAFCAALRSHRLNLFYG